MIRTRVRKILRDVWARKGRTFLVATAIFIGVAGTIALFSMSEIIVSQLREDIQEDELAMVQISMNVDPSAQLDNASYLKMIDESPGVTETMTGMEGRVIYFKKDAGAEDFESGIVLAYAVLSDDGTSLIDVPFEAEMPLEQMRLLQGGAWPAVGQNELMVEQRMAEEYGLEVGDPLFMRVLSPSRNPDENGATGTVEEWKISGIVFHPYSFAPATSIYTRVADGNYLAGFPGLNDFWLRFTDYPTAEEQVGHIQDLIANNTPYKPVFTQKEDPAKNSQIQGAQTIGSLMGTLALIALVVSGFLVINVISSLVVEQKRQIGIMKSMGATRGDNFFMYSGIAFVYGFLGVLLGVIVGIPGGNFAAQALAPELNTVLEGFQISPGSIILGVLIGLTVPVLASLIPVFNGTRVQILDAMTDLGIDARYGSGPIAKIISRLPIPITVRQGLSNVSIKKGRLFFTVITLAIAVGAFMGIFAIFEGFRSGINAFIETWNIEYGVSPNEPRDPDQVEAIVRENFGDDVKSFEPGFFQLIEFEGYAPEPGVGGPPGIFAYGYDITSEDPAFRFTIDKGETLTEENSANGIILSTLLAANLGKEVGDSVVMKVPGAAVEVTIVGVSDFPIEQAWMDWRSLATITDFTIDTITSDSPIPADLIPPQARGFIKYATAVTIDGYEGTLPDQQTIVLGLLPALLQYLPFNDGTYFDADEPGIVISQDLADRGGYSVGDTLSMTSVTPDGTSADYPIVGIFSPPPLMLGGGAVAETPAGVQMPGDFVGMFWRDLIAFDGATLETEPLPQAYFITTNREEPTAAEISDVVEDVTDVFANEGIPVSSFNFVEIKEQISSGFFVFQLILSAVALLIALVGALGLLTTLSMSVYERQKEIGVMRSIGASSRIVMIQFLTEGLVVGLIAWLVGLPLMVLIQFLLLEVTGFSETFPLELSPLAAVIGLIGMIVITAIASLWPSWAAARKTVSEILRYQ